MEPKENAKVIDKLGQLKEGFEMLPLCTKSAKIERWIWALFFGCKPLLTRTNSLHQEFAKTIARARRGVGKTDVREWQKQVVEAYRYRDVAGNKVEQLSQERLRWAAACGGTEAVG